MNFITIAHAMTAPTAQSGQGGGGMMGGFITIGLIFLVFYLLLIRPQQKQQKKLGQMRENLKKGDKLITTGGMFGTVDTVNPNSVIIYVNDKVKIEIAKSAISGLRNDKKQETEKKDSKDS